MISCSVTMTIADILAIPCVVYLYVLTHLAVFSSDDCLCGQLGRIVLGELISSLAPATQIFYSSAWSVW